MRKLSVCPIRFWSISRIETCFGKGTESALCLSEIDTKWNLGVPGAGVPMESQGWFPWNPRVGCPWGPRVGADGKKKNAKYNANAK